MPDLPEPGRNAYRGDVLPVVPLVFMGCRGPFWHCYAIDSKTGLNQNGQLWECAAQTVEVRSGALLSKGRA